MKDRTVVEVELEGHPRLWIFKDDLERGEGPLMPEPDHWKTGPFADSYAHVSDGKILRYRRIVGQADDLKVVEGSEVPA